MFARTARRYATVETQAVTFVLTTAGLPAGTCAKLNPSTVIRGALNEPRHPGTQQCCRSG